MEPQNSQINEIIKSDISLPSEFTEKALKTLPERAKEIIKKRFNLYGLGKRTLGEIGRDFQITRERIRQLEKSAIKKIQEENASELAKFRDFFSDIMGQNGGAAEQSFFLGQLAESVGKKYPEKDIEAEKRSIIFILTLVGEIKRKLADKKIKSVFYADEEALKTAQSAIGAAINFLQAEVRPLSEEELYAKINQAGLIGKNITPRAFGSYIRISKEIAENPFKQWGLAKWPLINPRNIRDKAYLAVSRQKEPAHFKKITRLVGDIWQGKNKPVLDETVHNELIKDKRFVLVGRGIYALAEWGYEKGTVRDIIKNVLSESDRPMSRDEIISKVSAKRLVKPGTIILNLKDAEFFEKTAEGLYKLK